MPKTTKKILCTTAITAILNLSFQPAYAVKIEELDDATNHSYSHPLMKEDLSLEDSQTNPTSAPQSATEADVVSWFFSTPLKTMIGAVSLVKQGVRFALENPGQAMTMGLLFQARTATSTLSLGSLTPLQGFTINGTGAGYYCGRSVSSAGDFNGDGLSDAIIGVFGANNNAGNSYVLYGAPSPASSKYGKYRDINQYTLKVACRSSFSHRTGEVLRDSKSLI